MKKFIYICSPYRGNIERNTEKARDHCREVMKEGHIPVAPHIYFTQFLDDDNPDERTMGIQTGLDILKACDEMWVYDVGLMSEGMKEEIRYAIEQNVVMRIKN